MLLLIRMTNKIISLGPACSVKYQIDHYTNRRQETYLFDWQMTDFSTICQILRAADDPTTLFRRDALEIYGNTATRSYVRVTSLPTFKSIHDVKWPWTEADLTDYIEKQVRRTRRLVTLIRSGTPIYFVRLGQLTIAAIAEFEAVMRDLNPACPYYVFCVGESTGIVSERVANIYLENVEKVPERMPSWTSPELNWSLLFNCISKMVRRSSLEETIAEVNTKM